MGIMKIDPFRGFEGMARKMNDFISEFDKGFSFEYGGFVPHADISEDEKHLYVTLEMSGLKKEEVKVTINDERVLFIKGTKKRDESNGDRTFIRAERKYGDFTRSFLLPENINKDSIQAKFENGLLELVFDKKEPEKPKEYEINIL